MWVQDVWGGSVVEELNGSPTEMLDRYQGTFSRGYEVDFYKITPTQSTTFSIQCVSGGGTIGGLFDSQGNIVTKADGTQVVDTNSGLLNNFAFNATLTQGNTYYLGFMNESSAPGSYSIFINNGSSYSNGYGTNDIRNSSSVLELASNTGYSNSLDGLCDINIEKFTPARSGSYTYGMLSTPFGSLGDPGPYIEGLFDSTGSSLLGLSTGSIPSITTNLTAGNTYYYAMTLDPTASNHYTSYLYNLTRNS